MLGPRFLSTLSDFVACYPQIELDLDFSDRIVDVIEEGCDAVIRTGRLRDFAVQQPLADGRLCRVPPDYLQQTRTFHILWPASRHLSPKVGALVDFLCARLAA